MGIGCMGIFDRPIHGPLPFPVPFTYRVLLTHLQSMHWDTMRQSATPPTPHMMHCKAAERLR